VTDHFFIGIFSFSKSGKAALGDEKTETSPFHLVFGKKTKKIKRKGEFSRNFPGKNLF